jgi:hypothetical protein
MKELPDPIETAEREVALRKFEMQSHFDALQAKLKRQASSPKLIAGVVVGAVAFAYLLLRPSKSRPAKQRGGAWPLIMQGAQTLLPLIAALHAAREAESAKKTVSRATGTPPVPAGDEP